MHDSAWYGPRAAIQQWKFSPMLQTVTFQRLCIDGSTSAAISHTSNNTSGYGTDPFNEGKVGRGKRPRSNDVGIHNLSTGHGKKQCVSMFPFVSPEMPLSFGFE